MVGEHTERLPAVPVGEHCAGLKGVGETAAVKGNRATHLKLCGGSLGQLLVHRYTCTYTELVYSTTETITHALTHTGVCILPSICCRPHYFKQAELLTHPYCLAVTASLTRGNHTLRWTQREGLCSPTVCRLCSAHWSGRKNCREKRGNMQTHTHFLLLSPCP